MKKTFEFPEMEILKVETECILIDFDSVDGDFDDDNAGDWA